MLHLLSHVHKHSTATLMDARKLCTIFHHAFLRPESQVYYMENDSSAIEEIVFQLISEVDYLYQMVGICAKVPETIIRLTRCE
jgi:hypothetical protein